MVSVRIFTEEIIGLHIKVSDNKGRSIDIRRTFLTTGKTHGFALSSLYAPIPRSTFLSDVSFLYAAINPKSGSSAAFGTTSAMNTVGELAEPMVCFLI